jgi:hypothetical protein
MLKKLLSVLLTKDESAARAQAYREAIHEAAKLGGTLFGPVAKGNRREFFCLDEHTWVWHEEWTDANGMRQVRTTRYDARPQGVYKAQDGQPYQPVGFEEARRLVYAVDRYNELIDAELAPYLQTAAA